MTNEITMNNLVVSMPLSDLIRLSFPNEIGANPLALSSIPSSGLAEEHEFRTNRLPNQHPS